MPLEQSGRPSQVVSQAGDAVNRDEDALEIPAFLRRQAN